MSKHRWTEGDTLECPCPRCEDWTAGTYKYRSVRLDESRVDVPNVLVLVCDVCGTTCGIPDQETDKLKEARERATAS